jgi:hypothetical protein
MKQKLLTLTVGLLHVFLLSAQNYVPIPEKNMAWFNYTGCGEDYWNITGDTLIGGFNYSKVSLYHVEYNVAPMPFNYCTPLAGITTSTSYAGAFRNDSIQKKVYIVPKNSSTEQVLYDFSLQPGDTLKDTYLSSLHGSAILERIDSISLGGIQRARYTFSHCGFDASQASVGDSLRLIEGIGSNQSFLSPYELCGYNGNIFYTLECVTYNGQAIYPSGSNCTVLTQLKETELSASINIYPNPSLQDEVSILSNGELKTIEILDIRGKSLRRETIYKDKQVIRIPENGIYFIRGFDTRGRLILTEKVVML